jgi:hypothetical protein
VGPVTVVDTEKAHGLLVKPLAAARLPPSRTVPCAAPALTVRSTPTSVLALALNDGVPEVVVHVRVVLLLDRTHGPGVAADTPLKNNDVSANAVLVGAVNTRLAIGALVPVLVAVSVIRPEFPGAMTGTYGCATVTVV